MWVLPPKLQPQLHCQLPSCAAHWPQDGQDSHQQSQTARPGRRGFKYILWPTIWLWQVAWPKLGNRTLLNSTFFKLFTVCILLLVVSTLSHIDMVFILTPIAAAPCQGAQLTTHIHSERLDGLQNHLIDFNMFQWDIVELVNQVGLMAQSQTDTLDFLSCYCLMRCTGSASQHLMAPVIFFLGRQHVECI